MRLQCFVCGNIFKKEELSEEQLKEIKCPKCGETKIINLDENKLDFWGILKNNSLSLVDKITSVISIILVEGIKFWVATKRTRDFVLTEITLFSCLSLFMLALQWKESSFRDRIESNMGAIGLCQIMPATARLLTGFYQMEYSRNSLYDIETNIKLSAKLLDVLYQEYQDPEVVLAGYNGGPWQAYYYRTDKKKLAAETANYIPKVIGKWKTYKKTLKAYNIEKNLKQAHD